MKVVRYTLLENGKVPQSMINGGYFPRPNGGQAPQDYDYIGYSLGWTGLEEFTSKADFENYINSFLTEYEVPLSAVPVTIQEVIDDFWLNRN